MLATTMMLAFFYLVVGDLILMHQKVIFNYDAFSGQPLSKPDKTGKQNLYKLKDKKERVYINYLTFVSSLVEVEEAQICVSSAVTVISYYSYLSKDYSYPSNFLRGPPLYL